MNTTIKNILENKVGIIYGNGTSKETIALYENKIGMSFAVSYREYLEYYGIVAFWGHEITGISRSMRTDVANVTLNERMRNPVATENMYVIERAGIDGIIIWQSSSGEIYRTDYQSIPRKIYKNFEEYLLSI